MDEFELQNQFCCLVTGDEKFQDMKTCRRILDFALQNYPAEQVVLLSGGKRGADSLVRYYANERHITLVEIPEETTMRKENAIETQKQQIFDYLSLYKRRGCIFFWDTKSPLLQSYYQTAKEHTIATRIVCINPQREHYGHFISAPLEFSLPTPKADTVRKIQTFERFPLLHIPDNFVVIDTETTGLSGYDEIVEFSVVSPDKRELYHSYFYPDQEVNPRAREVSGLYKAKLQGCPRFGQEWRKIQQAIGTNILIGHNIHSYDKRLCVQTLQKQSMNSDSVEAMFQNSIDTLKISKEWISAKSYSLNNLSTLVGITREEQHNSTDDCRMTIEFLESLENILKQAAHENAIDFLKKVPQSVLDGLEHDGR